MSDLEVTRSYKERLFHNSAEPYVDPSTVTDEDVDKITEIEWQRNQQLRRACPEPAFQLDLDVYPILEAEDFVIDTVMEAYFAGREVGMRISATEEVRGEIDSLKQRAETAETELEALKSNLRNVLNQKGK